MLKNRCAVVLDVHAARRTLMYENAVESRPESWSQGRSLLSAVSLCVRLTWMLNGTLNCDNRRSSGSTHVSFWTNQHLTSSWWNVESQEDRHAGCAYALRRIGCA